MNREKQREYAERAAGFARYRDGQSLSSCRTRAERIGWLEAQTGEGVCAVIDKYGAQVAEKIGA